MKTVGIIGGMGPLATVDIFSKIINNTVAKCDQEHIHIIIDNNTNITDRTAYIISGINNPLDEMIISAKRLEVAGADALIMPCNTAHFFADKIQEKVNIPIINMINITVDAIRTKYPKSKNVAVIATDGTKKSGLYDDALIRAGYNSLELGEDLQRDIMSSIYDGVKAGKIEEYIPLFQSVIDRIKSLNADIMIAACTEIPIFIPYINSDTPIIDPTLELALAAIKFAKG